MAPFEALYGRRRRIPLCWYQDSESVVVGSKLVLQNTEKIKLIQESMKTTQSRQKSYADKRQKPLEFVEGEHVFHVSQLRKYVHDLSHVVELDEIHVKETLTYEKRPVAMIDFKLKELRGKSTGLVKVLWDAATGKTIWKD
uniref:Uncharacterized protein n=1 Tax=Cajanus cajan TaxID=3821 RepID=A0A151TEG1_CAJCA|nr:hypothetical protein KK1_011652 [Cajanus cajan]